MLKPRGLANKCNTYLLFNTYNYYKSWWNKPYLPRQLVIYKIFKRVIFILKYEIILGRFSNYFLGEGQGLIPQYFHLY